MMCAMKTLGALALMALLLAGCGGKDATDTGPAPSADDLAAQLDCTDDSDDAADKVSCETEDAYLGITVYKSNDDRDVYLQSVSVPVLVGDRFVIDASDPAALDAAQKIVGGKVQ